jgi:hypothetical protein
MGFLNSPAAIAHVEGGFSEAISFGPTVESRVAASASVRPDDASDPAAETTSPAS